MPFLLEMQAAIWGMEHLQRCPFTLYTNHWPLEKLCQVQTKTLNQLQEAMQNFKFWIV